MDRMSKEQLLKEIERLYDLVDRLSVENERLRETIDSYDHYFDEGGK